MAAIDFPNSPSVNDTFTVGSKTWTWNGSYWISDEAATGLDGLNDVTISSPVDGEVIQYDNGEFVNSPVDYADLTSVPNDFTPSAHTHTKSEITDFAHASTHELGGSDEIEIAQSQVTDLVSDLADKQDDVITTQGDLVIGDASGDPVRLPVGSADQVLTSDGTTVSFQDAGGGGFPQYTLITSGTTTASTFTINSIPQDYDDLLLRIDLDDRLEFRINGLSLNEYKGYRIRQSSDSTFTFTRFLPNIWWGEILFLDYTLTNNTTSNRVAAISSGRSNNDATYAVMVYEEDAGAITSIESTVSTTGNFQLYGVTYA